MLELFGQLYMYFLSFIGICIGIGFAILGYGFKGFLMGAFFTIALGTVSFTIAAILLTIFVNIVLKSISAKANKILIPLIILGLVVDIFRYNSSSDYDEKKNDDNNDYESHEEIQEENHSNIIENEVDSNTDDSNVDNEEDEPVISESLEDNLVEQQVDLDTAPVPGAINTYETARGQISYLIEYYLQTYTAGDSSSLEYYVYPSTSLYTEQVDYVNSLNTRGIIVELIDYSIVSMEQLAEKEYIVTVEEYYTIDHPEKGFSDTSQTSVYTVELIDGEFYITELNLL